MSGTKKQKDDVPHLVFNEEVGSINQLHRLLTILSDPSTSEDDRVDAAEKLFVDQKGRAMGILINSGLSPEEAKGVLPNVFVKFLDPATRYLGKNGPPSASNLFYKVVRSVAVSFIREEIKQRSLQEAQLDLIKVTDDFEMEHAERDEDLRRLKAISRVYPLLSRNQQLIVEGIYHGLPLKKIAEENGWSSAYVSFQKKVIKKHAEKHL